MRTFESIGIGVPDVLLPAAGVAPEKWAVVACDQYTSEPEYWEKAAAIAGGAPSTLNLIYPEAYLEEPNPEARIARIQATMRDYLAKKLLVEREGFVYLERTAAGHVRRGLIVALDLDAYDYRADSRSLVRATEGTIVERLPPRIRVREGAAMELPHIMVLIDDPERTVIEPLAAKKASFEKLYDFDLMLGGGHLAGWRVTSREDEARVVSALGAIADAGRFRKRYALGEDRPVLLYAMGDGNHSLATAKAIWDKVKSSASPNDPRRWALVELVNVHDDALVFEPIHRVLFELAPGFDLARAFGEYLGGGLQLAPAADLAAMKRAVDANSQSVGIIDANGYRVGTITKPKGNLAVSSVQPFIGELSAQKKFRSVDYVHGTEAVEKLGKRAGNAGLYLPAMDKQDLFKSVILDGALPRKTFSMGEADEKRFYMEARRLG